MWYYCNSAGGSPENRLDCLQRVKNNAARLVLGRRGWDHANRLLRSLHWFPIRARALLGTILSPSAIVTKIHRLLPTLYSLFSQSINLPVLWVPQTLVSWLFHASNSTSMESVLGVLLADVVSGVAFLFLADDLNNVSQFIAMSCYLSDIYNENSNVSISGWECILILWKLDQWSSSMYAIYWLSNVLLILSHSIFVYCFVKFSRNVI